MDAAAADGGRQVVHLAGQEPVAVGLGAAVGARLEQRVGAEQVAAERGDLVVGEVAERLVRRLERQQVVAALLEDDHRPAGRRQDLGDRGAAGAGADDDGVAVGVGHAGPRAGGNSGSGKSMRAQPPPSRLPP